MHLWDGVLTPILFYFVEVDKHVTNYLTWYFSCDLISNLLHDLCYFPDCSISIYIILNSSQGHGNSSENGLEIVH